MAKRSLIACALAAATGGLVLVGCGGPPAREPQPAATRLIVAVKPQGRGVPTVTREISCPPETRRSVCRRLQETTREDFAPVPRDAVCTAIYGGPATATVKGRLRGPRLRAHFDLRNGCAIARWRRFAWLLGDPPGVQRRRQTDAHDRRHPHEWWMTPMGSFAPAP
jgi:hypothetical protein